HVVERYDAKKDYRAKFETDFGPIVIQLDKGAAPRHVRNFVDLVRQGFYNGNQFHRIIPGQAIIGGSPTGDPAAGSGYNLDPETSRSPIEARPVKPLLIKRVTLTEMAAKAATTKEAAGKPAAGKN